MFRMPKLSRPVFLGSALALIVLLGVGAFVARQAANAAEPLEGNRVTASDVRILVRAASSCPALTPARLAGQIMVASNFRDEPVDDMRAGGATGVAALTPEQWRKYAPWPGAEPSDREAAITALAHAMCQLVGQARALKIDQDPWRVALAAHRLGMDQVVAAGDIPAGARDYVDTADRYASWYALQPAFGGGPASPARAAGTTAAGGSVVPVPEAYVKAVAAAGRVCPEMPPALIAAQISATSGFDPNKLGPAGEQGIAQFLPGVWTTTVKSAAKRTPWDPSVAIPALGQTMCRLVEQSGGQYPAALATFTGGRERATAFAEVVTKAQAEYAKDTRLQSPKTPARSAPSPSATTKPKSPTGTKAPARDNQPPVKATDGVGAGGSFGPYFIVNLRRKTCVDLPNFGAGTRDGPVGQFTCAKTGDDNQEWTFELRGTDRDGYQLYWVRNKDDGFCLDAPGIGKVESNTPVNETGCYDNDNQYFRLEPKVTSGGWQYYWLRNTASKLCLDIPSEGNADPRAPLTLFACSSNNDHEWALVEKSEW
ncbi:RICIN domain-containing protein [Micromonospora sp. NPDC000663]|uniref:RICIN domain-containing protein n=1 Tax=Micromonospora sp. NPDC000663 TaxID=3364218 RepID=UPI0036CDB508